MLNEAKAIYPLNPGKCLSLPTKTKNLGTVKCFTPSYVWESSESDHLMYA